MLKQKKKKKFRRSGRQELKKNRIRRKGRKIQKKSSSKKQGKNINWKKRAVEFLFICFVGLVVWVLFFSGVLRIKNVEVRGYDKEVVVAEVQKIKEKKILNKISRDNLILFPRKNLKNAIQQRDLVVREVSCRKKFPDALLIAVEKRKQLFFWKFNDNEYQLRDEGGDFIKKFTTTENIDLQAECLQLTEKTGLPCFVFADKNENDKEDETKIKDFSEFAKNILKELKKTVYFSDRNTLGTNAFISREITVFNPKYGQLKFSLSGDLDKQMEVLKLFLEQKIDMADLHKLEYVDLTLDNKLIYKFKHNEIPENEIKAMEEVVEKERNDLDKN
jgi:hypothetical protein